MGKTEKVEEEKPQKESGPSNPGLSICPSCNEKTVARQGGCCVCVHCGFSDCF